MLNQRAVETLCDTILLRQVMDSELMFDTCKGNLSDLRRKLHLSLAKGNPK
jgi:hypothetical protein